MLKTPKVRCVGDIDRSLQPQHLRKEGKIGDEGTCGSGRREDGTVGAGLDVWTEQVRLAVVRMVRKNTGRLPALGAAGEAKSCIGERCANVIERMASDLPLLFRKRHITCWKFLWLVP